MSSVGAMSLRISVVVPSYNDAAMLDECLTALDAQTRLPDEVIVVDNGSTDTTVEVALRHGTRVVTELRRGIPQATWAGFDAARGDVFGRLDADSVPPSSWVARVVEAFESDPGLDVLSGPGRFYGKSRFTHWVAEHLYIGTYAHLIAAAFGHDVIFGSNFALRASAATMLRERVHRDDRDIHDDLDLTINLRPGMGVRFDERLVVGVSARPFDSFSRLARVFTMAFHTFAVNYREESFWSRRRAWTDARRIAGGRAADGIDGLETLGP